MLEEFKFKETSTKGHEYILYGTKSQHESSPEGFVVRIAGEIGN